MANDYEYDIFISYRRHDDDWVRWTRENFAATIETLLAPKLGKVAIFFDDKIELGRLWPEHLASALARSRILLPLLSRHTDPSSVIDLQWCLEQRIC